MTYQDIIQMVADGWEIVETKDENDNSYEYKEFDIVIENKNYCYDSIEKLTRNGLKQVNIHILLSKETENWVYETINDVKTDPRLKGLNAIVFLSLKKKGRGQGFHSLDKADFKKIIDYALENEISFGFDSCSANKFLESVKDSPKFEQFKQCSEPCESSIQSSYINVKGEYFPCSFTEGTIGWKEGINVLTCEDFIEDVWNHPKTRLFREHLLMNGRNCPIFNV